MKKISNKHSVVIYRILTALAGAAFTAVACLFTGHLAVGILGAILVCVIDEQILENQ